MVADQPFSIPVDRIACRFEGDLVLSEPVEAARRTLWRAMTAARPSAFDGALLRLDAHAVVDGALHLAFRRTAFSAYVATRDPGFAERHPGHDRADPLGLTAIVLTADRHAIVTRRSLTAEQNPGALYFVGGYAEPPAPGAPIDLFGEVAREIAEEIAVIDLIRPASFAIGLAYDPVYCHPELSFVTVSGRAARDVLAGAALASDRDEAADIVAVPLADLLAGDATGGATPRTWSFLKARDFLARHLATHPL